MLWNHCNPAALHYLFTNTLSVSKFVALCVCTVGICLVIQPEFLYPIIGRSRYKSYQHESSTYNTSPTTGYVLTITCGVMWCFTIAFNRRMTSSPDFRQYYTSHLFWLFTFGILMSSVLMLVSSTSYILHMSEASSFSFVSSQNDLKDLLHR